MFSNIFGDPKPGNKDELQEALTEVGIDPANAWAEIHHPDPDENPPFDGWVAEIRDESSGDLLELSTIGFGEKAVLEAALRDCGITEMTDVA